MVQLLLPFVAGQIARRWISGWMGRHGRLVGYVDRGSILLVVYGAFSEAVVRGIWSQVSIADLAKLLLVSAALLAVVLAATASARGCWAFPGKTRSPSPSVVRKRAWPAAFPWPASCFRPPAWA